MDQLNKEFTVLGTPNQASWPEAFKMMNKLGVKFHHYDKINILENVTGTSPEAANLIERMIACNPKDRINIEDVMTHRYFDSIKSTLPTTIRNYLAPDPRPG